MDATHTDFHGTTATADFTRKFFGGGIRIKDLFKKTYKQATIEYWLRPIDCVENGQQVGPGWGDFLICGNAQGQVVLVGQ